MRVVESVGFYFPNSVGGSEVYVSSLATKLRASGIECVVAAPGRSSEASWYVHEGSTSFATRSPSALGVVRRRAGCRLAISAVFEIWLREQRADVYHQHSWTTGCGLWHLRGCQAAWAQDGRHDATCRQTSVCAVPCCLRGAQPATARLCLNDAARVGCNRRACHRLWPGLWRPCRKAWAHWRASQGSVQPLAARALAANRRKNLQDMFAAADRVVAVCGWLRDVLLANGVPPRKIVLNRQGVGDGTPFGGSRRARTSLDVLRFGFLGRWDPVKGVHLLVEAFRRLPKPLPVELHILAVSAGADKEYREAVRRSAGGDPRIHFLPDAQNRGSAEFLASIDALIVPSQCLETGPLVVLEAFAADKPVLGSDLGGIKEIVSHERDGLLVAHADVNAWTAAMIQLASDRGLLERLRQGIGPVRTMSEVAHDMATLYRELLAIKTYAA